MQCQKDAATLLRLVCSVEKWSTALLAADALSALVASAMYGSDEVREACGNTLGAIIDHQGGNAISLRGQSGMAHGLHGSSQL